MAYDEIIRDHQNMTISRSAAYSQLTSVYATSQICHINFLPILTFS